MRSNDQHLDFDLELATARSNDNPVYYIQYAHARVASVMRQLQERGLAHDLGRGLAALSKLVESQELQLVKRVSAFPETVRQCAAQRAPHILVHYLRDLANDFHTYYSAHQFIVEEAGLRDARLDLALATQTVIRNGLELLGVSAPETM
jgi:arginyl-tRNA synthetase